MYTADVAGGTVRGGTNVGHLPSLAWESTLTTHEAVRTAKLQGQPRRGGARSKVTTATRQGHLQFPTATKAEPHQTSNRTMRGRSTKHRLQRLQSQPPEAEPISKLQRDRATSKFPTARRRGRRRTTKDRHRRLRSGLTQRLSIMVYRGTSAIPRAVTNVGYCTRAYDGSPPTLR